MLIASFWKGLHHLLQGLASRTLHAFSANFDHLSSMNFHWRESATYCTMPSMLLFSACQVMKFAKTNVSYILCKCGMNGKCLSTLWSTIKLPWTLYIDSPHFTHQFAFSWIPWKNMQPFELGCITLYANPNFKVVVVSYSVASNVFSCGNTLCFSKPNSSFTNAFMVPCVLQQFIINSVVAKVDKVDVW